MDWKKSKRLLVMLACVYWVMAVAIYAIGHEQFRYQRVTTASLSPAYHIGELVDGMEVRQRVTVPADELESVYLKVGTFQRENAGLLRVALIDDGDRTLAQGQADVAAMADGQFVAIPLEEPLTGCKDQPLTLLITTEGCASGSAVTIYAGNMISTGRFDIAQQIDEADCYRIGEETGTGMLCMELHGSNELSFYRVYWFAIAGVFLLLTLYALLAWRAARKGKSNLLALVLTVYCRYGFLVRQLVSRDFKTKYKRSVLGMLWSFLNPLLTMLVQYVVFSTLFRSDIPNFPVYLISGIVFFNFFNEAVAMGMNAITGNAALIKKVYMPKYIYPISKIFSSLINFALSLLPMLLVILLTGTPIRPSMLLIVFDILCLVGFTMGMALILSTAMVFFQDMQFLWGIISMIWMYLTPIFYPESIIPGRFIRLYHMNPLYQYITFARTCVMDGVSPAPQAYLWCLGSSLVVLALGLVFFKREQDRFIMYL